MRTVACSVCSCFNDTVKGGICCFMLNFVLICDNLLLLFEALLFMHCLLTDKGVKSKTGNIGYGLVYNEIEIAHIYV